MLIREQADSGKPTAIAEPESQIAMVYQELARQVGARIVLQEAAAGDAEHYHQRRLTHPVGGRLATLAAPARA
jgi:hypothetical protein